MPLREAGRLNDRAAEGWPQPCTLLRTAHACSQCCSVAVSWGVSCADCCCNLYVPVTKYQPPAGHSCCTLRCADLQHDRSWAPAAHRRVLLYDRKALRAMHVCGPRHRPVSLGLSASVLSSCCGCLGTNRRGLLGTELCLWHLTCGTHCRTDTAGARARMAQTCLAPWSSREVAS